MELSFVLSAIRRRWWLVLLITGAIFALAVAYSGRVGAQYKSVAVLDMKQFDDPFAAADPTADRFIATEIEYLTKDGIRDTVANRVTQQHPELPPENATTVRLKVSVAQKPATDAVYITALDAIPAKAQILAQTYADVYIKDLTARSTGQLTKQRESIDEQLTKLQTAQKDINIKLAGLPLKQEDQTQQDRITQAGYLSELQVVTSQYNEQLRLKSQLDTSIQLGVQTQQVQGAVLPTEPEPSSLVKYAIAGLLVGLILGAVAATAIASFSRKVLDVVQLEEVLETEVVGTLPFHRRLAASPRRAFDFLPPEHAAFVDQLCVRAESATRDHLSTLTIAVVGTQRSAGTTTVALAMAGRFARNGQRVVVIDGDTLEPRISREFDALGDGGIPALLASSVSTERTGRRQRLGAARAVYTPTSLPEVVVLGVGSQTGSRTLRRTNAEEVLTLAAESSTQVIIIDGGPLLDLASTVTLANIVDAIVLAVPGKDQRLEPLVTVNRLLAARRGGLLPVMTAPRHAIKLPWKRDDVKGAITAKSEVAYLDEPAAAIEEPAADDAPRRLGESAGARF